jgi:hypothetical protein
MSPPETGTTMEKTTTHYINFGPFPPNLPGPIRAGLCGQGQGQARQLGQHTAGAFGSLQRVVQVCDGPHQE